MRRDHASEVVPLQPPGNEHRVSWAVRNALWLIGITPLIPQVVGSAANIWHNVIHIKPLLSDAQHAVFLSTITTFNSAVYPTLLLVWVWAIHSLRVPFMRLLHGQPVASEALPRARQRVINLPWWGTGLSGV